MNILIQTPSFGKHGGIRVLVEHANGLVRLGHDVTLQSLATNSTLDWIKVEPDVNIQIGKIFFAPNQFDVIIAGSPFVALALAESNLRGKKFMLLQMCEELFNPNNEAYVRECLKAYRLDMPIIGISKWNEKRLYEVHGRNPAYPFWYIGNGVSDEFKPGIKDEGLTILVEGWIGYNHAKDQEAIAPKVAKRLKEKYGAKIIAYSQFPKDTTKFGNLPFLQYKDVPDEYHTAPDTDTIVRLYQRAHLMFKASRYDARACAPVEAMKCGTPTARAIIEGDDDLIDQYNSLRCGYDENELFEIADKFIRDVLFRKEIEANGLDYAEKMLNWQLWTKELEKIISQ